MLDIVQEVGKYCEKAKDVTFWLSTDQEYLLIKYRNGNKKEEIRISNSLFDLACAPVDKKYWPIVEKFNKEVAEATKDIKKKYEKDLDDHARLKTEKADEFVLWRIKKHFNIND